MNVFTCWDNVGRYGGGESNGGIVWAGTAIGMVHVDQS